MAQLSTLYSHLPLYQLPRNLVFARDINAATTEIGLGDYLDITYTILVRLGDTETPLVLDTGSSDLWVVSSACHESTCTSGVPLYPQSTSAFQPASPPLEARLFYGDSLTGTHAFGQIGSDIAGIAGLNIQNQFFAAINDTNTTVLQTGAAGILGLGFPVNSVIWSELFKARSGTAKSGTNSHINNAYTNPKTSAATTHGRTRTPFPDLSSLLPPQPLAQKRGSIQPSISDLLASFATSGPLISRFAQSGLQSPSFTISLQRLTILPPASPSTPPSPSGLFSLGSLPPGVTNESLTWVPLRGYTPSQGGLPSPSSSPTEVYPIAWEVPIDAVFIDGRRLPDSRLSPGIAVTALIDTGNSLIRGPADVVQAMMGAISGADGTFDCAVEHTMAFMIGGKLFPVDPRDFINPIGVNSGARGRNGNGSGIGSGNDGGSGNASGSGSGLRCKPNVVATDPPHMGFLYSWSLGDPFLKSNIASFYFGNITHPTSDPPRMGFMSTVQADAGARLGDAVGAADTGAGFKETTAPAPHASPSTTFTFDGVPLADSTSLGGLSGSGSSSSSSGNGEDGGNNGKATSGTFRVGIGTEKMVVMWAVVWVAMAVVGGL